MGAEHKKLIIAEFRAGAWRATSDGVPKAKGAATFEWAFPEILALEQGWQPVVGMEIHRRGGLPESYGPLNLAQEMAKEYAEDERPRWKEMIELLGQINYSLQIANEHLREIRNAALRQ